MNQSPTPNIPTPLPWASLAVVAALFVASAAFWSWEARGGHAPIKEFIERMFPAASEVLGWRMLSALGNGWSLAVCLLCWLQVTRRPERVVQCLLALILAGILATVLKSIANRVRPEGDQGASWPSGHSAAIFAIATAIAAGRGRLLFSYPVAVLVACSRVVLNRHFPADVLAGSALGILAGTALLRWPAPAPAWLGSRAVRLLAGAILFLLCVFRKTMDFQAYEFLGIVGAPLFLALVLRQLLERAPLDPA